MNIDSVKVRMYRHGFGDCFLLQFFQGESRKYTMMIDCGLKLNDSVPGITMEKVRDNIASVLTNGEDDATPQLDTLVITHEHWDHISAFHPDQALFDHFKIKKIWMAWTEDPDDEDAKLLNKSLCKRVNALKSAVDKMKKSKAKYARFTQQFAGGSAMLAARQQFTADLEDILSFFGPMAVTKTPSGISVKDKYTISVDTQKAIDHVRTFAGSEAGIRYCLPGECLEDKRSLPGVRIFVLGPPKNKLLTKDSPSSGKNKEVYFGDRSAVTGFVDGIMALDASESGYDNSQPFSPGVMNGVDEAKSHPFFRSTYFDRAFSWRTIEDDWMDMAGSLALQMDSDTNNSSLVLAIQMPNGKVLLFPGDAQVGNWLSWHDLEWTVGRGSDKEVINATTLLNNTILYKVGHHASHNATLKEKGLELMIDEDLVALVPEKERQYNGIPYTPLVKTLRKKTKGRLIFSADRNYKPESVRKTKPEGLSSTEWVEFKKNLEIEPLFIEWTINV